jgi:hypothetical protein
MKTTIPDLGGSKKAQGKKGTMEHGNITDDFVINHNYTAVVELRLLVTSMILGTCIVKFRYQCQTN